MQRAPGIPHALCSPGARGFLHNSGASRRGIVDVHPIDTFHDRRLCSKRAFAGLGLPLPLLRGCCHVPLEADSIV